jgi:tetratricopeptide (TPR) repeat protein
VFLCFSGSADLLAAKPKSTDSQFLQYLYMQLHPSAKATKASKKDEAIFSQLVRSAGESLKNSTATEKRVLNELESWIGANFHSQLAAKAIFMRAGIYYKHKRRAEALLDWFNIIHLFPKSFYASTSRKHIQDVIKTDRFKKNKAAIESILSLKLSGKMSDRHAALLKEMAKLESSAFRDKLALAYSRFLANHRSHSKAAMVQKLLADNRIKADRELGVFHYQTLIKIYPGSVYVPHALIAIAEIQKTRSSQVSSAIGKYRRVIRKYPKSSYARLAYLKLASVYEKQKKDKVKAIETWKQLAKKYPRSKETAEAFESIGRVYENQKRYREAVSVYRKVHLATRDTDMNIRALKKASLVASGKLKDYRLMVEINNQMIKSYPRHDESVKAMFRNAQAYEKKLNDSKQALVIYRNIIKRYPKHYMAKKADRRIKSMQRRSSLDLF